MEDKKTFYRIASFKLDNKTFVRYSSRELGDAYLRIENNKYYYPTTDEFIKIINIFYNKENRNIFLMSNDISLNHKLFKFLPKINHKGKTVVLSSALLLTLLTGCGTSLSTNSLYSSQNRPLSEIVDLSETNVVNDETYNSKENASRSYDIDYVGDTYINVNNSELFDKVFDKEVTLGDINSIVDNNKNINNEYKEFIKNYMKELVDYYPDLELRVFAYNLENLKFNFLNDTQIHANVNDTCSAYWDYENDIINVSENLDLSNTWNLVVLRHELGHLGNYFVIQKGEYTYKYTFQSAYGGYNVMEGMNVIFTTMPYMDYYESVNQDNLGYPLISNELRIILECIDYKPEMAISNNIYLLEDRMNDVMGDEVDSHVIMSLIDLQQVENENQVITTDRKDYADLYSYITKMYIKTHLSNDMSYDEINEAKETLKASLLKGVVNPEFVYVDTIEDEFSNYCLENNITSSLSR